MEKRIGVVGIVIEDKTQSARQVNDVLSLFGDIIIGRMGIPHRAHDISVISLIVEGGTDEIGALTGKLGQIAGIAVKSVMTKTVVS